MDGVDVPVRWLSLNRTSQIGAADQFLSMRIVPDGREGSMVFARALRDDEVDVGEAVVFSPGFGERLCLRSGTRVRIDDVDRLAVRDETGYASVTNTIWTWLHLTGKASPEQFRFALATSRRLDGSHLALAALLAALRELSGAESKQRTHAFRAIAAAEVLVIALNRAVDLIEKCPGQFLVKVSVPSIMKRKRSALTALRDRFEHLDESATGRRKHVLEPNVVSIFNQKRFLVDGTLVFGKHELSVPHDVPRILVESRAYMIEAVGAMCGEFSLPPDFELGSTTGASTD